MPSITPHLRKCVSYTNTAKTDLKFKQSCTDFKIIFFENYFFQKKNIFVIFWSSCYSVINKIFVIIYIFVNIYENQSEETFHVSYIITVFQKLILLETVFH